MPFFGSSLRPKLFLPTISLVSGFWDDRLAVKQSLILKYKIRSACAPVGKCPGSLKQI